MAYMRLACEGVWETFYNHRLELVGVIRHGETRRDGDKFIVAFAEDGKGPILIGDWDEAYERMQESMNRVERDGLYEV